MLAGIAGAAQYRTHVLRCGHAKDLQLAGHAFGMGFSHTGFVCYVAGAPLWEILAAGQWSSPAFMRYLDLHCLETELVVQSHLDESEDELEEV